MIAIYIRELIYIYKVKKNYEYSRLSLSFSLENYYNKYYNLI